MKISGIDNLDIGMSNIEIEGKVTYEKAPRHIEGDNDKGHYDFYSQFVVIDDGTGKIGCNVTFGKEEYKLEKGVIARVKGKLEEYKDKNGEMQKSLKCSLVGISKGNKETDVQLEVAKEFFDDKAKESMGRQIVEKEEIETSVESQPHAFNELEKKDPMYKKLPTKKPNAYQSKDNYWKDKLEWEKYTWKYNRAGMSRSNGVNYAVSMVNVLLTHKIIKPKKDVVMENFWDLAGTFGKYIFDGKAKTKEKEVKPATKEEKIALARHITERKKLEIKDEDAPFPGEIIAPEDLPE